MTVKKRVYMLLSLLFGITLMVSCTYFFPKYQKEDLAKEEPFSSIVGKTLTTKNVCYIAKDDENMLYENPYSIRMDNDFYSKEGYLQTIPVGTELKIEKATYFIRDNGHFAYKVVLGTVFLKDLNKEVKFEYEWKPQVPEEPLDNRFQYIVYPLAPWQEERTPFKFDVDDNSASAYIWPN